MNTQRQMCQQTLAPHTWNRQPPSHRPQTQLHSKSTKTQMHSKSTNTNAFQIHPAKSFSSIKPQPRPVDTPLNSNLEFLSHCLSFNKNSLASTCTPLPLITWLCALKKYQSASESSVLFSSLILHLRHTPSHPKECPQFAAGP